MKLDCLGHISARFQKIEMLICILNDTVTPNRVQLQKYLEQQSFTILNKWVLALVTKLVVVSG